MRLLTLNPILRKDVLQRMCAFLYTDYSYFQRNVWKATYFFFLRIGDFLHHGRFCALIKK